ncbi:helix-turn-helix domain-containing protein [Natranaeroarchaeum sulfidigenes]|uniref:Transcriptional regulator, contains HTH domain n=1 Tax=Natranaeroarchaeum sulfidigenes TaxID=2784880 RepID=A0A897N0Q7_9EURY|nr:helix-turn-helix domain-containing protein [Natranaeroarchaeum sulfidigenes]QSG04255.1 Transcriptional regulator, contains HTH domain [Natranaeroarchaeum sulfidigenes]
MSDTRDPDMRQLMEAADPDFTVVMSCVFGVNEHVTRTYIQLLDQPGSTVEELADALDRDRSNVNRALTTLLDLGLATRERRLLDSGGYVYQYMAVPLPEAKEMLKEGLDAWAEQVHSVIEEFEENR